MLHKGGTVLINVENKKVGLIFRNHAHDYSFPKGHVEEGETLVECALRETEEETGRKCHLALENEIGTVKYKTKEDEVTVHMFLAVDDGQTDKKIAEIDKENLLWKNISEVHKYLSYFNLKDFWEEVKPQVQLFLNQKQK